MGVSGSILPETPIKIKLNVITFLINVSIVTLWFTLNLHYSTLLNRFIEMRSNTIEHAKRAYQDD